MTRTSTAFLALTLGLAFAPPAPVEAQATATDWKEIGKPALRPFQPQQPRRVVLANGMVILLQEDHELPLVRGFARIRGGSREENGAKAGLVSILGEAWRTGGTRARTGDELDDYLEARAAKVETDGGLDSTSISFDAMKGDFDDVFNVFVELLRQPEFREDKIALAKNQMNTGIARRNDDPIDIASREAARLVYGADSPYGREPEYATVAAVTRQDLLDWHKRYVHPNNVVMGVAGDFDARAMEQKLRKALASWPKGPAAEAVKVDFKDPKPGVYFVAKDDVNQSNIRLVHLGIRRDNPDYYALEVMNEVLGGGFAARLFSNIRSKKGLAYAVGGGVRSSFDHPGLFILSMSTKSETTAAAIDALFEEIEGLRKTPATPEELQRAKDAILNSFVFRFDSKQKVLMEKMAYEFYGYPPDFLERYRAGIEKTTAEDVARVARQYVHKDRAAVLVVGKQADFDRPLSSFGPVTAVDITIPEPGGTRAAAAASDAQGRALLAKVVEGLGGKAKVAGVKALRQKASVLTRGPQGEMAIQVESVTAFPDRMRQQMTTPMGVMTMVVSPEAAFMATPMGTRDLPASQRESALKDLKTSPLYVAQNADAPSVVVTAGAAEKVGEVEARILEVSVDGAQTRWWVDPASGRILKSATRVAGMGGPPAEQVTEFSDWREVSGLSLAFKRKQMRGGEPSGSVELTEVEVNPAIDPTAFEKPPEPPKP